MSIQSHQKKYASTFCIMFILFTGTRVGAQQQQQPPASGTNSGAVSAGTTSSSDSSVSNTVSSGTGQSGIQTGQGVQQPQFRAFGESINQNTSDFIGRGTENGFVGQRLSGQTNSGGAIGPQFGALGGNQGGTNDGRGQATGPSRAARLRPRHRIAFSYSPLRGDIVRSNLQEHLRLLESRIIGSTATLSADGTVTLEGTAIDSEARKLAEALARLEPGVRRVENHISIASSPPQFDNPAQSAD